MLKKGDFYSVEFFRKIRDEHAVLMSGKSEEEIIAFFSSQTCRTNTSGRPQKTPFRSAFRAG